MPTPPVDRVRAYKAETAATGGTASDDRPYPRVLNPQQDALDAAGLYMQQAGTADKGVAIWREGNLMHFRDNSMPAGTSVVLSSLVPVAPPAPQARTIVSFNWTPGSPYLWTNGIPGGSIELGGAAKDSRFRAEVGAATKIRINAYCSARAAVSVTLGLEWSGDNGATWTDSLTELTFLTLSSLGDVTSGWITPKNTTLKELFRLVLVDKSDPTKKRADATFGVITVELL